jgi:FixJ family two-component response regulator
MKVRHLGAIAIVDDDESVRTAVEALLRSIGYEVKTFASAELFLESGALRETRCLVLDVHMSGIDGLELQRRLNEAGSRVPIIFVTANEEGTQRQRAIEAGAVNFFRKPFDAKAFLAAIQSALWPSPNKLGRSSFFEATSPYASPKYRQSKHS